MGLAARSTLVGIAGAHRATENYATTQYSIKKRLPLTWLKVLRALGTPSITSSSAGTGIPLSPYYSGSSVAQLRIERAEVAKLQLLIRSCVSASTISLTSLFLGCGELAHLFQIAHPLFWFAIASGSFGVAGSNFIYLKRLWES